MFWSAFSSLRRDVPTPPDVQIHLDPRLPLDFSRKYQMHRQQLDLHQKRLPFMMRLFQTVSWQMLTLYELHRGSPRLGPSPTDDYFSADDHSARTPSRKSSLDHFSADDPSVTLPSRKSSVCAMPSGTRFSADDAPLAPSSSTEKMVLNPEMICLCQRILCLRASLSPGLDEEILRLRCRGVLVPAHLARVFFHQV